MKFVLIGLLLIASCFGQAGTVNFTPPTPGVVTATAGSISCVLTGNAVPATAIAVDCNIGGTHIPFTIPIIVGNAFTADYHWNGDAVTFSFQRAAGGPITWTAAATPNGGTTASGSGNF